MSPNTKYVHYPRTPVSHLNNTDTQKMSRRERREMVEKFQVTRLIFNCFMAWFLIVMSLSLPFMDEALVALYPDTYAGLHSAAEIILAEPDATDRLPAGYWIDESKTTQRILCIKAWDGSWATWSWSSSHPWMELDHDSGWFFPITLAIGTLFIGVLLGVAVTKFVPLKYSILWRNSITI